MPPDCLILAFDTSAAHCAAALLSGDRVLAEALEPMEKGQAERLMPFLEELLSGAGVSWQDLTAVAVGTGPGNFTGVRIAVAAARGLALGLGIPAIGVTRLEALAHGLPRPVMVVEDARRGEIYAQEFGTFQTEKARLTDVSDAGYGVGTGTPCVGSAAAATSQVWGCEMWQPRYPMVEAIARIAGQRSSTPQPRPAPFYLRPADALPPTDPPPVILP